jgi:hypothetical protein
MESEQVRLERSIGKLVESADGAVACHLMRLDDESLASLQDPKVAGGAALAFWLAMSDRLGYMPRSVGSEVLVTFIQLLENERALEAQRRSGGSGFYGPSLAAAMAGYLRGGKEGLATAMKEFPVLNDYEKDRFSESTLD